MSHVSSLNGLTGNVTTENVLAAVPSGTNKRTGRLTLTGATPVVVANTLVTATSNIFLTSQVDGGTVTGRAWVSGRTPGTSFSVTGVASDTSIVAWLLAEPEA